MMDTDEKFAAADFQKEAKRMMESLLLAEPENHMAMYGKSLILFNEGKLLEASELFSKALETAPEGSGLQIAAIREKIEKTVLKVPVKVDPLPARAAIIEVTESKPKLRTCEHCNKVFSKQFSLNRHLLLHSGDRPFRCDKCERGFTQRADLDRHLSVHSSDLNFECKECDKRFKTKKNLNCHMITHSDDRPFPCSFCDKTFKSRKMLNFHSNLHTHANLFPCELCDKKFPAKSYLKNHMKKHDDRKPFECTWCPMAFKREPDLNKHVRSKHSDGEDVQQEEEAN